MQYDDNLVHIDWKKSGIRKIWAIVILLGLAVLGYLGVRL
jgi:hypothetical protein